MDAQEWMSGILDKMKDALGLSPPKAIQLIVSLNTVCPFSITQINPGCDLNCLQMSAEWRSAAERGEETYFHPYSIN